VTEYRRQWCLVFLISNVSVSLTNAGCDDANQHLVYARRFKVERPNLKWATLFVNRRCLDLADIGAVVIVIANSP
jgi:hypothetical protein